MAQEEETRMEYRTLGRTGLRVSEMGFGGWAIGGGFCIAGKGIGYGPTDDATSKRALERAAAGSHPK